MRRCPRFWLGVATVGVLLTLLAWPALSRLDAQDEQAEAVSRLRQVAKASPRRALQAAPSAGLTDEVLGKLKTEFADLLEQRIKQALGQSTPVTYERALTGFDALDDQERVEQLRDWALLAAYAQMDPDPARTQLALGTRASLRRAHRIGLNQYAYGTGRIAALATGEYLLLVPARDDSKDGFDGRDATRLLDERRSSDGAVPDMVRVCAYRVTRTGAAPKLEVRYLRTMRGSDFQTPAYGFVSAKVQNLADLRQALTQIDELLAVRFENNTAQIEGRRYPRQATDLVRRPVDLTDLKVIHDGVAANKGFSSFGFSLDPWIDGKTLAAALRQVRSDHLRSGAVPPAGKEVLNRKLTLDADDAKRTVEMPGGRTIQLTAKAFPFDFVQDKEYDVRLLSANNVDALVLVQDDKGKTVALGKDAAGNDSVLRFVPPKSERLQVIAASQLGFGEVTLQVFEIDAGPAQTKPVVEQGDLTAEVKRKVHEHKLIAGKNYVIGLESKDFDTFLKIEDAKGKLLAENDDISPLDLNSRLVFAPPETGMYRIIATSYLERGKGAYKLTISTMTVAPEIAQLDQVIERLADRGVFRAPARVFEDDSGLFKLLDFLTSAGGPQAAQLRQLGRRIEEASQRHQVHVPRYEGAIAGTEVGMTLYYTDLTAKLFAMDSIRADNPAGKLGGPALLDFAPLARVTLPQGDGFTFVPLTEVRLAAHQVPEVKKFHQGRLWFAPKRAGFTVTEPADGPGMVRFAPVATSLFMKSRDRQIADESDANVHYETYTRFWNNHFSSIADAEPEYARLNELMKWGIVLLQAYAQRGATPLAQLAAEPAPPRDLRFATWYSEAGKARRIGARVPLPFRTAQERQPDEPVDSLRPVLSRSYQLGGLPGFEFTQSLAGGVTGPDARDLAERRIPGKLPFDLPANLVPEKVATDGVGKDWLPRLDGSKLKVSLPDYESTVKGAAGRRYWRTPTLDAVLAKPTIPEMTTRLLFDKTGQSPLSFQEGLDLGPLLQSHGQVKVGRAGPAGIAIHIEPGTMDSLPLILDRVATGRSLEGNLVKEIRSDIAGEVLYVRAALDQEPWLAVRLGGAAGGPPKGPPEQLPPPPPGDPWGKRFRYGRLGDLLTLEATVVNQAAVSSAPVTEPRFIRLDVQASQVHNQPSWFRPPGKDRLFVEFNGGKTELRIPAAGAAGAAGALGRPVTEIYAEAGLGPVLAGAETSDVFRLYDVILQQSSPNRILETSLLRDSYYLQHVGGSWILGRNPAADAILSGAPTVRRPTIVTVVARSAGPRAIRVEFEGFRFPPQGRLVIPADATPQERQAAQSIVRRINDNPQLLDIARRLPELTLERLEEIAQRQAALQRAPVATVVTPGTDLVVRLPEKEGEINLGSALDAVGRGQPLPAQWAGLRDRTIRLRIGTQEPEGLAETLRQLQPALERNGTRFVLDLGVDGAEQRTQSLLDWDRASVLNDERSLEQVQRWGPIVQRMLEALPPPPPGPRSLRVVVGHMEGNAAFLERQGGQARRGDYRNQHVILLVCTENREAVLRFAAQGIAEGARSFVLPTGTLDVRSVPLALFELNRNTGLASGEISSEMMRLAYRRAAVGLRECAGAANPRDAVLKRYGNAFGTEVLRLVPNASQAEFQSLIDALEADAQRLQQAVDVRPTRPSSGAETGHESAWRWVG